MSETCRNHRITVTQGMSGFFAVMIADYEDMDWHPDAVMTGMGRYKKQSDAVIEAEAWAEVEGIPFVMPEINESEARQDVEAQIKEIIPDIKVIHLGD